MNPENATRPGPTAGDRLIGWIIGPVFLLCAAWFLWGPGPSEIPLAERVAVDRAALSTAPPRTVLSSPPTVEVAGFTKQCAECHSLFSLTRDRTFTGSQHRNIVQGHGMNDRCFNCHSHDDPARLVLSNETTVPFTESAVLCAQCHGTTYRDWERGMHGRTTGSWDTTSTAHGRLTCVACHDPHSPAFGPMSILPGPNTLRMGEPHAPNGEGRRNPLRHWSGVNANHDHDDEATP